MRSKHRLVTVPARDLKNRTGDIVRRIERGEHILITKRGKALAVMRPARNVSKAGATRRREPDIIAQGVGMLEGVLTLKDFLAEKRVEKRLEERRCKTRR